MQWRRTAERTRDGFTWAPSRTTSFLREGRRWYGGQSNDAKIPETENAEVGGSGLEKTRAGGRVTRGRDFSGGAAYSQQKKPPRTEEDFRTDYYDARRILEPDRMSAS